jgi:outer membrane protein assembly factor BamD
MRRVSAGVLVAVLIVAAGCAGKKKVIPPEKLWSQADEAYNDEAWEYAVDRYKMFLDQHPFDPRAEEAELRIAESYYLSRRYPEAIASFGDFERMHPTSPNLAQVEYQLGMSYLAQASTPDRDQQPYTNAMTYFRNAADRFPQSPYAEKARLRMKECREALARHEADVARWYLRHSNIRAAESRLRGMLVDYPDCEATAQVLYDFAKFYSSRDEDEGATLALATIARHHPDGKLGREARERLGPTNPFPESQDPTTLMVAMLDRVRDQSDRQKAPATVSAYPEVGGVNAP